MSMKLNWGDLLEHGNASKFARLYLDSLGKFNTVPQNKIANNVQRLVDDVAASQTALFIFEANRQPFLNAPPGINTNQGFYGDSEFIFNLTQIVGTWEITVELFSRPFQSTGTEGPRALHFCSNVVNTPVVKQVVRVLIPAIPFYAIAFRVVTQAASNIDFIADAYFSGVWFSA